MTSRDYLKDLDFLFPVLYKHISGKCSPYGTAMAIHSSFLAYFPFLRNKIEHYEIFMLSGVKRAGHEADHSPPSSAEVKECVELYLHSPSTPSWRGS
jgi:hypothetical protein